MPLALLLPFPVRPGSPVEWVHYNGPGVCHLALNQSLSSLSSFLQPGHTNGFLGAIISPVKIVSHPVHGYALHVVDACEGVEIAWG